MVPYRAGGLVLVPFTASPAAAPQVLLAVTDAGVWARRLDGGAFPPPPGDAITDPDFPDFRFHFEIEAAGETIPGHPEEAGCLPETLCVSGALPGRIEVLARIVGPKPNGFFRPTLVKLTTSEVRVEIEQVSTGIRKSYVLEGARPGFDELPGLFDRHGLPPSP
jgi:hypothetical protein